MNKNKPTEKRIGADISDRTAGIRRRAEEQHAKKYVDIINNVLYRPLVRNQP